MIEKLTPEHRFVLDSVRSAFARARFGTEPGPRARALNWGKVVSIAHEQGLMPLLQPALEAAADAMPAGDRQTFQTSYRNAVIRAKLQLEPTLRQVLTGFRDAGLRPIVLKGAARAYTVYPRPIQRTFTDVDLLLSSDEIDDARDVLRGMAFRSDGNPARGSHHLDAYYSPSGLVGVELHDRLMRCDSPYALPITGFRERSRVAAVAGVEARVFCDEDALLYTCVHLAYHHRYRWYLLRSLTDILALTARPDAPIDWNLFVENTRASRTAGAVYWPLRLAREWLDAPIPRAVLARIGTPELIAGFIGAFIDPTYIIDNQVPDGGVGRVVYDNLLNWSLYSGCSTRQQIRAVWSSIFPPPDAVGHLPTATTHSRLRYGSYLASPKRIGRGLVGFTRLIYRVAHRRPEQSPARN